MNTAPEETGYPGQWRLIAETDQEGYKADLAEREKKRGNAGQALKNQGYLNCAPSSGASGLNPIPTLGTAIQESTVFRHVL